MQLITHLLMTLTSLERNSSPQLEKICIVFVKMTTPLNDSNIIRAELSDVQFLPKIGSHLSTKMWRVIDYKLKHYKQIVHKERGASKGFVQE